MISKLKEISNGTGIIVDSNHYYKTTATRINNILTESAGFDELKTPSEVLMMIRKQDIADDYVDRLEKLLLILKNMNYCDYPDNTLEIMNELKSNISTCCSAEDCDNLYKFIFEICNRFNKVSDAQYISEVDKAYLNEQAIGLDNGESKTVVMEIFNKLTKLESTSLECDLFEIKNMVEAMLQSPCDFYVKLFDTLMKYLYSKFSNNVSVLRRIQSILSEILPMLNIQDFNMTINQEYVFDLSKMVKDYIAKFGLYVENAKVMREPEYDISVELGLDKLYHESTSELLTEGAIKQGIKSAVRNVKKVDKRVSRDIDSTIQRIIDDYRDGQTSRMESKILGSTWKASKFLKSLILSGGLYAIPSVGPALSLIYIITRVGTNKHTEYKVKQKLLNDLKGELEIVEEKIKDADRNDDTKAKYKLMRLSNHIKRSIDKIQFNLREF